MDCFLVVVGEPFAVKLLDLIRNIGMQNCRIWNLYGPAETTIACSFHLVNIALNAESIPIGCPLPNYRCLTMDEFSQPVMIGQEGELFVGGVGVYSGYFGRDDLTAKALTEIDGEIFYQTGDLVRMDNNGVLHYLGRKDHQIKLHGQRIELGEIQRCLLDTSISACVVTKWGDDHLVAYVQSSDIDGEQLREHCESHLPPHMIPSIFIVLEQLPLNANGKIDRKRLPSPDFSQNLSIHVGNHIELIAPRNKIEVNIHHIWCDIFQQNQISIDANIFTIGGHSLLFMRLFQQYKTDFHLETNTLSIADLFRNPTIIGHAQLIYQIVDNTQNIGDYSWCSLYLIEGKIHFLSLISSLFCFSVLAKASFAQERIFLDEQIRFALEHKNIMYNIPLYYRISSSTNHVSITRLHHAFQAVITRHKSLRTALYLDTNGNIIQRCLDSVVINNNEKVYGFSVINIPDDDDDFYIDKTINGILNHSDVFDLSKGRVIDCHILHHCHPNDDLLSKNDLVLFNIHHSAFDGGSISTFLRDLSLAYETNCSLPVNDNTLQYIDYAVHERVIDMTSSQEFWHSELEGYNLERSLRLPVDHHRLSSDQRSGIASTVQINFNNDITTAFINYASSHQVTPFQLGLATFYIFLFKLTHSQNDLCIGTVNTNRYRTELQNIIGMFVSTLPYRIPLDPRWSFDELVQHVREKCLSILEHSHYPLQHILADFRLNQSNVPFLETMFDFVTVSSDHDHFSLNGVNLEQMSTEHPHEMTKFDFLLTFVYNPTSENSQLSCTLVCSRDVYDKTTVAQIAQRFEYLFEQLFGTKSSAILLDDSITSISKLSVILPDEAEEMQAVIFRRMGNTVNEGM